MVFKGEVWQGRMIEQGFCANTQFVSLPPLAVYRIMFRHGNCSLIFQAKVNYTALCNSLIQFYRDLNLVENRQENTLLACAQIVLDLD